MTSRFGGGAGLGIPQALDVEHFAQARIQELEFLNAAVAAVSSQDGGEKGAAPPSAGGGLHDQSQALPRHMRRRTASHKPRRMPVALKNSGKKGRGKNNSRSRKATSGRPFTGKDSEENLDVPSAGIPSADEKNEDGFPNLEGGAGVVGKNVAAGKEGPMRCRKHRRRPRAMLEARSPHAEGILGEERPSRWLETHIWHAKRMHMQEQWGFMLPIKSNRGPRAVVEAALKHCTVQDLTFLRPLEMRGPFKFLIGLLTAVLDPLDSRAIHPDCVAGLVEASTHLYRVQQFPLGCIAPVRVLWNPPDSCNNNSCGEDDEGERDATAEEEEIRRLWLWVHPAAAEEALKELRKASVLGGATWVGNIEVGAVAGGLCRLRVRGTKAHDVVQQVLRTAVPECHSPPAGGVSFENAARENAVHWQAMASRFTAGGGSGSSGADGGQGVSAGPRSAVSIPLQVSTGSVLALTALDPRERPRLESRLAASRAPPPRRGDGKTDGKGAGRSGNHASDSSHSDSPGGGMEDKREGEVREAGKDGASSGKSWASSCWPRRWAPVSPLWDPDARALSAKLAHARRDHVINEARGKERARKAWDVVAKTSPSAMLPPALAETASAVAVHPPSSASGFAVKNRRARVASTDRADGISPVILISSSGKSTKAHGVAEGFESNCTGRGRKEVERKRRAVGAGWDLVLSAGWAPVFFQSLVIAGARALSMEDADWLKVETGDACFPADYPDTASGRRHWNEIGRESESAWRRTRPKHRGYKLPPSSHAPRLPPPKLDERRPSVPAPYDGPHAETGEASAPEAMGLPSRGMEVVLGVEEKGGGGDSQPEATASIVKLHHDRHDRGIGAKGDVSSTLFRPDFRAIAGVVVDGGVAHDGFGIEGDDREPFALVRGFHYIQAFLPEHEIGGAGGMPPPLQLAFPTALEVRIRQDKGVPGTGCLLYAASHRDHVLWKRGRRNRKAWPGFGKTVNDSTKVDSATPRVLDCGDYRGSDEALVGKKNEQCEQETGQLRPRRAIGAVSSGGFSFLRGGGVGRAVCEAVAFRDALAVTVSFPSHRVVGGGGSEGSGQPSALVMIGNEAGDWFRPALIDIVV